jgi:cobyrinic acid a,c-diamide synthase
MKGFAVCGTGSGVGKTTISAGLMAALRKRGLRVQPFKCGPDFIDLGHHARVCGRPSHNLDTWLLSAERNRQIFISACNGADVAIVEGMMGMFDGVRGSGEEGSSAEIAKLLGLPVVLIVDASSAARSVAALVLGFRTFDPKIWLAAVILNRVAGDGHARTLIEALESLDPALIVGWIPSDPQIALQERHLGLQTAVEKSWSGAETERLASLIENGLSLERLMAACEIDFPLRKAAPETFPAPIARIGIARDRAFCFYYEAALGELRKQGAELIEFSPLADSRLPAGLDGLYLGGGYPELYAETLSANAALLADLRRFAERGHPIYGECGGLMYLSRHLHTLDGKRWPMADLLPLSIEMTEKLVRFGYAEIRFVEDGFAEKGSHLRGHSFHYSRVVEEAGTQTKAVVDYSLSGETQPEGFTAGNIFGSYIHLHFASDPSLAARFVAMARASQKREVEA